MPNYNWFCRSCEKDVEVFRTMAEIESQPDEQCCETPDRIRTPPKASIGFGKKWNPEGWKTGGGNKGRYGRI